MIPDVLAYPLDEARRRLEAEGYSVTVTETHPPRAGAPAGRARVIRQRFEAPHVALTVTYERYEPAPRPSGDRR